METASFFSFVSHSRSSGSPALLPVKPKPSETPLRRRMHIGALVINEASSSRLVKPMTESALLPVKEEIERQHHALEEIAARRLDHVEGGIVIFDDSDEDAPGPSNPVRHGNPG
ncbi:SEC12-like protein 2 [Hordeum vulgare]|nr:SEC12-like protein 2 [Hordeum vulgare]